MQIITIFDSTVFFSYPFFVCHVPVYLTERFHFFLSQAERETCFSSRRQFFVCQLYCRVNLLKASSLFELQSKVDGFRRFR